MYKEIFNDFKYSTYIETTGNVMNNKSNVSLGEITLLLLMLHLGRSSNAVCYLLLLSQMHHRVIIAAA